MVPATEPRIWLLPTPKAMAVGAPSLEDRSPLIDSFQTTAALAGTAIAARSITITNVFMLFSRLKGNAVWGATYSSTDPASLGTGRVGLVARAFLFN
jgi:hypothetical protein